VRITSSGDCAKYKGCRSAIAIVPTLRRRKRYPNRIWGSSAASERDSLEKKSLKEEEHNYDGEHDQT
jgi:hypothetical protein